MPTSTGAHISVRGDLLMADATNNKKPPEHIHYQIERTADVGGYSEQNDTTCQFIIN